MKEYLISLEKDEYRRQLFFSQPNTHNFEIFSAINTMNLEWEDLKNIFDIEAFKKQYQRPITKGEVGCTLSHLAVYEKIINDNSIEEDAYCFICEDDALFTNNCIDTINKLIKKIHSNDIILIGQSKIASIENTSLEINYPSTFRFLMKKIGNNHYYGYPYKNYFAGTVAYLIKKSVARQILTDRTERNIKPFWLADDFILFEKLFKMKTIAVRPLLAIENPVLNSNLETDRKTISSNIIKQTIKYPLKKIMAIYKNMRYL